MKTPEVTVLTAVRNGSRHLAQTIDSIREQTFTDWEYVIVDDASDDDTAAIIDDYAGRDPRIRRVTRSEPGGPYAAANDGLRESTGRRIVRIDADDVALPRRIEGQLAFLDGHPDLRSCASSWRLMDETGAIDRQVRRPPVMTSPALKWSLCVTGGLVHSTACVDRDALDSLGRYAETPVSADLRLWLSLARCGWLGVMPTPTVLWRRHPTQIGAQRIALQREVSARWIQAHLAAITGVPWTYEDAWNLWGTGRWQSVPLAAGISVLDRWHDSWTSDTSLTAPERSDLARLTRRVRLRHLRYNRRAGLGAAVAALTRTVRRLPQGARSARVGR